MSCVTNPLKDRPSACAEAADAYGAKKAYTGEKRIAFIGYDPTTPRGELRRTRNRLISMETSTNKVGTTVPVVRLEFVYDYMGRRASKTVYEWETNHWSLTTDHCFVYDSWNLIKEVGRTVPGEPSCETNINYYTWGLDLSGSLQGAGGIGGLLSRVSTVYGQEPTVSEYTFDANGNVSELLTGTGEIAAHYVEAERKSDCRRKSDPYGKTLVATGALADENKFRFSTKPVEENTGLVLYEYRIYIPDLGRFGSRDPLVHGLDMARFIDRSAVQDESYNILDSENPYLAFRNNAMHVFDALGLLGIYYEAAMETGCDPVKGDDWAHTEPNSLTGTITHDCTHKGAAPMCNSQTYIKINIHNYTSCDAKCDVECSFWYRATTATGNSKEDGGKMHISLEWSVGTKSHQYPQEFGRSAWHYPPPQSTTVNWVGMDFDEITVSSGESTTIGRLAPYLLSYGLNVRIRESAGLTCTSTCEIPWWGAGSGP